MNRKQLRRSGQGRAAGNRTLVAATGRRSVWRHPWGQWIGWTWVALCFAAIVWQPFRLGFFLDDWTENTLTAGGLHRFSAAMFRASYRIDQSRPGMAPLRFLLNSLLGSSPFLWQAALVASNLLVMWAVTRFGRKIWPDSASKVSLASLLAVGASWLLYPWNQGCSFWTCLAVLNLLLAVFAWIGVSAIDDWRRKRGWIPLAGLVYLGICLAYEAFYFQWIPLLLIGVMLTIDEGIPKAAIARSALTLALAQGVAAGWHRWSRDGGQRAILANWMQIARQNLRMAPGQMLLSAKEVGIALSISVGLWIVVAAAVLFLDARSGRIRTRAALLAAVVASGSLLSLVAMSLGGRVFLGVGVESRTYALPSFWLTFGLVAAFSRWGFRPSALGYSLSALSIAIAALLGYAHLLRAGDWADAWAEQTAILKQAPLDAIRGTEPDATIVFVNRREVNGAPVFSGGYDLITAMPTRFGPSVARRYVVYNRWSGVLSWDRQILRYPELDPLTAPHVYLWEPARRWFEKAAGPFKVLPDLSVCHVEPNGSCSW